MSTPPDARFALDRRALARAFDRAGAGYDAAAWLQQHARMELLERLQYFDLRLEGLLDLGAGTCQAAAALARRYPRARVLAIDLAPGMLAAAPPQRWRARYARVCADGYALPLVDRCADLVFSSLMLQWCDRPEALFAEVARVLRPAGLLVFASFGPASLEELRAAWAEADGDAHVNQFPDMPQLGAALSQAGFVEPVLDVERLRHDYVDAYALMRELKQLGARNAARTRSRGLTGRRRMSRMVSAYERLRTPAGLPATYELIFGAAFRRSAARAALEPGATAAPPADGTPDGAAPREVVIPVDALRRRRP